MRRIDIDSLSEDELIELNRKKFDHSAQIPQSNALAFRHAGLPRR